MSPNRRYQTKNGKILVVDDEPAERDGLARLVGQWGYEVETASSGEEALNLIETQHPAVVLTDLVLPEMDGLTLLQKLKETGRPPIVLLVTGHGSVESAVEAMRHGAFDYLTKPVDATRLQVLLEKSIEQESLSREVSFLRHQLRQKGSFGQLVGQSRNMQEVYRWIELAATSTAPVLVYGESGTGKELVARTVHDLSNRRNRPFVAINCAAIPETLIESELFGHERGAFTGATDRRIGRFELADRGTLLLDEVGDLGAEAQAKLLRAIESGEIERVGGSKPIRVDVRILSATNKDLTRAVADGMFREDLYFRLNVIPLAIPPLRERPDDIPALVRHFSALHRGRTGQPLTSWSGDAIDALTRYRWPGNVRELANIVERLAILNPGREVTSGEVREVLPNGPVRLAEPAALPNATVLEASLTDTLDDYERMLITRALSVAGGNIAEAARRLQTDRPNLYRRMKRLGIVESDRGERGERVESRT